MLKKLLLAAVLVLAVLVVVYCVYLAVLLYPILTADAPEMTMGTLGQDEVELFEKTLGLSIPDGTERVWVVLTVDHGAIARVRLDLPTEQVDELINSKVLDGAASVDEVFMSPPPEHTNTGWWQIDMPPEDNEQRLYLVRSVHKRVGIATKGERSSVYFRYGMDTVPQELSEFMEAHPIEIWSWFPPRALTYGGCWERPSE